jgi:hypothetical protein
MDIIKIKNIIRPYKKLWRLLKGAQRGLNIILFPFYQIYIWFFAVKHKIKNDKYVLFFSGSIGDVFYMARLLDLFADKYGPSLAIAPVRYTEIFRLLSNNDKVKYLWLNDVKIEKLRKALNVTRVFEDQPLQPGKIRPTFMGLYHHLHALVMADRVNTPDVYSWIVGLDKDISYRYVSYTETDVSKAMEILSAAEKNISKIALINPICYTHKSLTVNGWKGVADALLECGYKPVFNMKRNADDNRRNANGESQFIVPDGFPIVEIPAYLVPVCADMVGIGCARHGGAFDLLYSFNKKDNGSILISVSPKVSLNAFQKADPFYDTIAQFYEKHSGKPLKRSILLDDVDNEREAYTKIMNVLKPVTL